MKQACFVTGTDTGVGKTLVAAALIHRFAMAGQRVTGMKPVAAGTEPDGSNEDVRALRAAGNVTVAPEDFNPYLFAPAIAPHLATAELGRTIELDRIVRAFQALAARAEVVVVEGAGGFYVPLNAREDMADLARMLRLPVLLVVGMRLGCLNHALLTAAAIEARGLTLAGWVANCIDPAMARLEANIDTLRRRIAAPCLGVVPFDASPDYRAVAARLALPAAAVD